MSDVRNAKEHQPTPKEMLSQLRQARQGLQKHWAGKKQEMIDGRKDSLKESLSAAQRALAPLAKVRDEAKASAKKVYDQVWGAADAERQGLINAANNHYAVVETEARKAREKSCEIACGLMQQASAPINSKYKADLEEIEVDFKQEMGKIEEALKKELKKIDEAIATVEAKVAEEEQNRQEAIAKAKAALAAVQQTPAASAS